MRYYKDFRYVEFVVNLPFKDGFALYLRCADLIKNDQDREVRDHVRSLWLIEIQNGYKGSFDEYYKKQTTKAEVSSMGKNERDSESDRIIKEHKEIKNIKLKERSFDL